MEKIGVNKRFVNENIYITNNLGSFKTQEEALSKAKRSFGSELIYQNKNNLWEVSELKEKGWFFEELNNLYMAWSADTIDIDNEKMNKLGIKNAYITFGLSNQVFDVDELKIEKKQHLSNSKKIHKFIESIFED